MEKVSQKDMQQSVGLTTPQSLLTVALLHLSLVLIT